MLEPDDPTNTDNAAGPDAAAEPATGRPARAPRARRAPAAARTRVSALAKELQRSSREILEVIAELGGTGRTASSSIDEELAGQVRERFATDTPAAEPAPATEPAPAAEELVPPAESDVSPAPVVPGVLFQPPSEAPVSAPRPRRRRATAASGAPGAEPAALTPSADDAVQPADTDLGAAVGAGDDTAEPDDVRAAAIDEATGARRRRRRGRRGRGGAKPSADGEDTTDTDDEPVDEAGSTGAADATNASDEPADGDGDEAGDEAGGEATGTRRRRRRRRSSGSADSSGEDDPPNTVTHVREPAAKNKQRDADDDGVRGVKGSTRLEARRQRRRDGRDTSRRRPPILTEAEFLARREAVDRIMAVRQNGDRTQIAVLEDGVLVEHYVTRARATSYVGNVYLGRVQNVLPSMEAAFIDIGKGRNGVLYAGEVNWDAAGLEGKARAIEHALKSGDPVLVQVTKDPVGHKGARLTSQISLPGRFLVYVPGGGMTGISRRLPDTERHRLKSILKKIVPEDAGVIVRTAAEGASEEDLTRDVDRLKAEWETIEKKAASPKNAPSLLHGEPDLAIRVVRDVFNEDFQQLIVQGDEAWRTVSEYVDGVAPDLRERVKRHTKDTDLFHDLRVDEGLAKALDRKVYLPSGGSLVIDRTEAMTVIDVNTGKFIGSGGNLEETVTRNNLEAAEEIVRQLRLRDVGGIVVIDFIDMVLESNRELVLRRLTECLGRDRTKHQVAEVTSLGLVQMTRKRVGEGLLEAFSETCEVCHGRGVILHSEPVVDSGSTSEDDEERPPAAAKARRRRGKRAADPAEPTPEVSDEQREKALAAMTAIHRAAHPELDDDELNSLAGLELDAVESVLAQRSADRAAAARSRDGAAVADDDTTGDAAPDGASDGPHGSTSAAVEAVAGLETPPPGPSPDPVDTERPARPRRRRAASRPAGPPSAAS